VEQNGVERSKVADQEADLLLFVLNNNEPLHDDERELMEALVGRQVIVIINKVDLAQKVELDEVERAFGKESIVQMSLLEQTGRDALEKVIADKFFDGELESNDLTYVSNVRHIHLLEQTLRALDDAIAACGDYVPIDIMQIDVHAAWELLGEVVGDAVNESLLDQIFSQFCLGK
jgi:tRNA modification GTPase